MGLLTRAASRVSSALGRDSRLIVAMRPAYEWFLDLSSGLQGAEWSVNGEPLRVDPRVRRFLAQRVEPELFSFLRSAVRPGEVILDVGSFLGVYAILMARW